MRKIFFFLLKKGIKLLSKHRLGKFYPIKRIWPKLFDFFFSNLHPTVTQVQGHKMYLDEKDSLRLSLSGIYGAFETEFIKQKINNGDVVLDLGANIGYYTLIFAKLVGDKGKIYAFEPDPNNFALLKKNVETNGYENVTLEQKAVSNKTGKLKLFLCENNKGDHRIYDSHDGRQSIEIDAILLDDYFGDYNGKIDFIKFDIQGAEGGAVQGMSNLLKKNKKVQIVTEFWPIGLKKFGIGSEEYLKLLIEHDFKLYHINEQKMNIEPANFPKLLKTYTPEKENFTNLLCIKNN